MGIVISIGLALAAIAWFKSYARKKRRQSLLAKYGDPEVVEMIMSRTFWQGQTEEQLTDSLGHPADVDSRVMKTKKRQIWKYHPAGKNRYRLRITLDDGRVIGWENKSG